MSLTGFMEDSTATSVSKDKGLPISTGYRGAAALTATIAAGASLSDVVTIPHGYRIDALIVASTWDTAVITAQVSLDNVTYYDAYDEFATEISVTPSVGKAADLGPETSLRISKRYIKLRSGTVGTPVAQVDATTIKIWLVSM